MILVSVLPMASCFCLLVCQHGFNPKTVESTKVHFFFPFLCFSTRVQIRVACGLYFSYLLGYFKICNMTYNAQIWQGHTMDIAGTYTHTQSYLMRFNALRILKYPGIIGYDIVVLYLTLFFV